MQAQQFSMPTCLQWRCNDTADAFACAAGIIAAVGNNSIGVAGVAWGGSVKLLGCHSTGPSIPHDAECLRWCRDGGGAKIAVYPWTFDGRSQEFEEELIRYQDWGGLFFSTSVSTYPGMHLLPSMINVGATSSYDNTAFEANYTANLTHVFAPGISTWSTYNANGYVMLQGARPAMAHAAGAAALLWSYRPELTAQQVKSLLLENVDKQDGLKFKCQSGGVLNVNNAMLAAEAALPPLARLPPSGPTLLPPALSPHPPPYSSPLYPPSIPAKQPFGLEEALSGGGGGGGSNVNVRVVVGATIGAASASLIAVLLAFFMYRRRVQQRQDLQKEASKCNGSGSSTAKAIDSSSGSEGPVTASGGACTLAPPLAASERTGRDVLSASASLLLCLPCLVATVSESGARPGRIPRWKKREDGSAAADAPKDIGAQVSQGDAVAHT
eukprot:360719-Chlamydomonas_euryale.AAC.5